MVNAIQHKSFTCTSNGMTNVLVSPVQVHAPIAPNTQINEKSINHFSGNAIWDTGATNTVITKKVSKLLGLIPCSTTISNGVNGPAEVNVYMIGMMLPNRVGIRSFMVTECEKLSGGNDILIGMDIICLGDFAVSNFQGKTQFTFRFPSCESIDFVHQKINHKPAITEKVIGRNDPCPCKSGKKYKYCCGQSA